MAAWVVVITCSVLFAFCASYPANTSVSIIKEKGSYEGASELQSVSNNNQFARKGSRICMKKLGCFNLTEDFFHSLYRPYNLLPYNRVTINTRFHLYTKSNPKEYYDLDTEYPSQIKLSPLDPKVPTKFVVHGFLDNKLYGKWMEVLKDNLLLHGQYNVIIVDWSGGNGPPYSQAAANSRVVGAEIALMIETLQKMKNIFPMDCHIIGHSLGSHIAGYAGERLTTLGRISAVDPAEPFFQYMPPSVRVDPTDADFVDVIHTDSKSILLLGLGMSQPVGHVDFYPNDGKNQPGCGTDAIRSIFMEGLVDATRRFIACNHQRAVDFFIHSINYRKITPVGYQCSSWNDYTRGFCADCGKDGSKCATMGIQADQFRPMKNDSKSIKFYLSTSGSAPYWVYHYQVSIKLLKPKINPVDQKGKIFLTLHGGCNSLKFPITPKSISLYHGATYRFLISTDKNLCAIKSVTFVWQSASWSLFKTPTIYVENVKIVPMNIVDEGERKKYERKFCDKPENAIKSKIPVSMSNPCV